MKKNPASNNTMWIQHYEAWSCLFKFYPLLIQFNKDFNEVTRIDLVGPELVADEKWVNEDLRKISFKFFILTSLKVEIWFSVTLPSLGNRTTGRLSHRFGINNLGISIVKEQLSRRTNGQISNGMPKTAFDLD